MIWPVLLAALEVGAPPDVSRPVALTVRPAVAQCRRWERIELVIEGVPPVRNPFDTDEVDLTVEITGPGARRTVVPACWVQPFERARRPRAGRTADWLHPRGDGVWRAWYAPPAVGRYTAVARLRGRVGTAVSPRVAFRCIPSPRRGYLRVSPSNPRYLAFEDGTPFFAVGQNVAFVKDLADTARIFGRLGAAGANFARIWTCSEDWGMALEARKSAFGRSWDWRPPFVPEPGDAGGRLCVRLAGAAGAEVRIDPSHPVALEPGRRYTLRCEVRTDGAARVSVAVFGEALGESVSSPGDWTALERTFVAPQSAWWLEGAALRLEVQGEAFVRGISLTTEGTRWNLLWEADPNRPATGIVSQVDAALLDAVVEAAERSGIYLMLCLLTRDLYMERLRDPESAAYEAAIRDAKRLVRYAVARWGASTHVAVWQYWNELDPGVPAERFYREVGAALSRYDPWRRPRTTSAWAPNPRDWASPDIDVACLHHYLRPVDGALFADETAAVLERARLLLQGSPGKPALLAEFGLADDQWRPHPIAERDVDWIHLRRAIWASALSGLAGTVMPWWWERLDERNAYGIYRGIAAFLRDAPFGRPDFGPAEALTSDTALRAVCLAGGGEARLWLADSRATWRRRAVEGAEAAEVRGAVVTLPSMPAGRYRVRWVRTEDGATLSETEARAGAAGLRLEAPPFRGDIACVVKRLP